MLLVLPRLSLSLSLGHGKSWAVANDQELRSRTAMTSGVCYNFPVKTTHGFEAIAGRRAFWPRPSGWRCPVGQRADLASLVRRLRLTE